MELPLYCGTKDKRILEFIFVPDCTEASVVVVPSDDDDYDYCSRCFLRSGLRLPGRLVKKPYLLKEGILLVDS